MNLDAMERALVEELERLRRPGLRGEELGEEIARSKALEGIVAQGNAIAKNQLEATRLVAEIRGVADGATVRATDRLLGEGGRK